MSFEKIPTRVIRRVPLGDLQGKIQSVSVTHSQIMQETEIDFLFERVSFGRAAYKCRACLDNDIQADSWLVQSPTFSLVDKNGDPIEELPYTVQRWFAAHTKSHSTMFQWAKGVIARGR